MSEKISDIELVISILQSGHSVELPAKGYSMYPALKPGYIVTVAPFDEKTVVPGDVVICKSGNDLIMHRLIRTAIDDSGRKIYISRGDSQNEEDNPKSFDSIIGVATSYNKKGKTVQIRSFLPGKFTYKLNHWLLWMQSQRNLPQRAFRKLRGIASAGFHRLRNNR